MVRVRELSSVSRNAAFRFVDQAARNDVEHTFDVFATDNCGMKVTPVE